MPFIPVPTSSTATATTNAIDAAIRTPVAANGAALGRDTRRATDSGPKPKLRRVSLASWSTLLDPVDRVDEHRPGRRVHDDH